MVFGELYRFRVETWDTKQVGVRLLNVFKKYEKLMFMDFIRTTYYFRNHNPLFWKKRGYAGGDIFVRVGTDDEIYFYLNEGTSVRYATMEPSYQRITHPNSLGTNVGVGGMLFVSKNKPRPGIAPRNFTKLISEKHQRAFLFDVTRAVVTGIRVRKAMGGAKFIG